MYIAQLVQTGYECREFDQLIGVVATKEEVLKAALRYAMKDEVLLALAENLDQRVLVLATPMNDELLVCGNSEIVVVWEGDKSWMGRRMVSDEKCAACGKDKYSEEHTDEECLKVVMRPHADRLREALKKFEQWKEEEN